MQTSQSAVNMGAWSCTAWQVDFVVLKDDGFTDGLSTTPVNATPGLCSSAEQMTNSPDIKKVTRAPSAILFIGSPRRPASECSTLSIAKQHIITWYPEFKGGRKPFR
jgi:hypothetical protein